MKTLWSYWTVGFLVLAGWLVGCVTPSGLSRRGAWHVQWWTDFHEPGPWTLQGGPGALATYGNDGYRLAGVLPNVDVWSLHPTVYAAVRLAAHPRADITTAIPAAYGLVCGYRDLRHFVLFALNTLGEYAVGVHTSQGWKPLHASDMDFRPHPAVRPAPQDNRMMVECGDTGLRLWVNGHLLTAVNVPVPHGQVGMWLHTPPQSAAASWGVVFHDLTLWTWQRP